MKTETSVKITSRPLRPQLIMAPAFLMSAMGSGMSIGHSAILLPELLAKNSTIVINEDMGSWIASIYSIVAPLGSLLGGLSIDLWGRKKLIFIGTIIRFLGWLLITCAQNAETILIGRLLEGFSRNQLATSVTVSIDELMDSKLRGMMICGAVTSVSLGIITISCLGTFFHWRTASGLASFLTFISFVCLFLIKESPTWLIRKNRKKRAEEVLRYLWGPGNDLQVKRELTELNVKLQLHDVAQSSSLRRQILSWRKLIIRPCILKSFLILHFFNIIQVFCGLTLFTVYSIDILSRIRNGIEELDDHVTTIVISSLRTATVFFTCFVVFYIGRRKICIASGSFSFVSAFSLGLILLARNIRGDTWMDQVVEAYLTFTLIIIFCVSMSFGFLIFPALMIGETQASCIRGVACGYIYAINELVLGSVVKLYPWLMDILQIHGLFLMFGISCAICTIFVYLFLPETQGLTLQEIEEYFRQPNILWITRHTVLKANNIKEETGEDSNSILMNEHQNNDEKDEIDDGGSVIMAVA